MNKYISLCKDHENLTMGTHVTLKVYLKFLTFYWCIILHLVSSNQSMIFHRIILLINFNNAAINSVIKFNQRILLTKTDLTILPLIILKQLNSRCFYLIGCHRHINVDRKLLTKFKTYLWIKMKVIFLFHMLNKAFISFY